MRSSFETRSLKGICPESKGINIFLPIQVSHTDLLSSWGSWVEILIISLDFSFNLKGPYPPVVSTSLKSNLWRSSKPFKKNPPPPLPRFTEYVGLRRFKRTVLVVESKNLEGRIPFPTKSESYIHCVWVLSSVYPLYVSDVFELKNRWTLNGPKPRILVN